MVSTWLKRSNGIIQKALSDCVFYADLRIWANEMENTENRIVFKLNPGTVLFFDNWRLLHGRNAFTGKRAIVGAYVSKAEYDSKLRIHGLIH